ncbi:MAG: hypothetical protein CM1200mP34_2540 [Verrucomicrobiales bacterium]|nr:MAG: hypothetical protein CM1200mP34_2540 [Verrucomicrobiales bacterium]
MAKSGKVIGNLMIDLDPREHQAARSRRAHLRQITRATEADATEALELSGWNIKRAAARLPKR